MDGAYLRNPKSLSYQLPSFDKNSKLILISPYEEIVLTDCILLDKIDQSVGDLTEIISLDVRNCSRQEGLPENIASLEQLSELLIDQSSIEKVPELGGMKNLGTFSAKYCKITASDPKVIWVLSKGADVIVG